MERAEGTEPKPQAPDSLIYNQNKMVAARAIADGNTFGHRSYRVETRRQSFRRPNMISIRLRLLSRRLSYLTGLSRDFRPGCRALFPYLQGPHGTNPRHDPREYTHIVPPLPTIVKCLGRAILFRRITPPQPIAIDEDNTAEHATVINAWHTMALREIRPEPRHLSFTQPAKITHITPSVRGD